MIDQSLVDRQIALERQMRTSGIETYRKKITQAKEKDREGETTYGIQLLRTAVEPMDKAIRSFLKATKEHGAGRRATAVIYMELVESDVLALLTAKVVIDKISRDATFTNTAMALSQVIEDEVRFSHFEETNKPLFRTVIRDLDKRTSHAVHRRKTLLKSMKKDEIDWKGWPMADRMQLGSKLIELFVESTGLIQVVTRSSPDGKDTPIHIEMTPETSKWIYGKNAHCELLRPDYVPMIVPPVDWESPVGGGYLSRAVRPLKLVKTRNWNYLEELCNSDMVIPYQAVNAMQRTAWKVNVGVLKTIEGFVQARSTLGGIPAFEDEERPPTPADIATNKEARILWKRSAHKVDTANIKIRSKRLQFMKILNVANNFKDEAAFYFPYTLDFRGRIYSVPQGMTPQGPDHAKALLTFSEGKPIVDQQAADWLAIHGANVYGNDKVSFSERVQWVKDNTHHIIASAKDPLDYRWWCQPEVDKPWQFLAFCFDWAGYMQVGIGYVSSLPIALDGSCNGLQHFSAMLRDPIGGAAVNLTPSEQPQDIYQKVADVVIERLARAAKREPIAAQWLAYGINRKTTKRSVMVLPYGGTEFAFRTFIHEHMVERKEKGEAWPFEGNGWEAAVYLGKRVQEAIGQVVVAAVGAMGWLQQVAKLVSKEGIPITWKAPTGFPVLQASYKEEAIRVTTQLFGRCRFTLRQKTEEIDCPAQKNGISPNFVHSLDAAALMFCVVSALDYDITSFAMVHDSYATVAADTHSLAVCLRHAFVGIYSEDVLGGFAKEALAVLPEGAELPPMPLMGDLDLSLVLQSDFFFA